MGPSNPERGNKKAKYKQHFQDSEMEGLFLDFKKYYLDVDKEIANKCMSLLSKFLTTDQVDILDIGAGDGSVSLSCVESLSREKDIGKYVGVDISQKLVDLLEEKRKEFQKYVKQTSFECFDVDHFESKQSFDIVLAMNSFYGISFGVITDLLHSLKPQGIIAILLNSENNLTIDVTRNFVEPIMSGEDLIDWLHSKNIKHTAFDVDSDLIGRDDYLSGRRINKSCEPVLRYILRRPKGSLNDIVEYLLDKPDTYFQAPQKFIVIS